MKSKSKINTKEKAISIEAELPISLYELALYIIRRKEDKSKLFDLLNNKAEIVNIKIKKIIKEVLHKKKAEVKLKELKFDYNDSEDFMMGVAYFKVKLKGTKNELKKLSGENKLFYFDWKEYLENGNQANA